MIGLVQICILFRTEVRHTRGEARQLRTPAKPHEGSPPVPSSDDAPPVSADPRAPRCPGCDGALPHAPSTLCPHCGGAIDILAAYLTRMPASVIIAHAGFAAASGLLLFASGFFLLLTIMTRPGRPGPTLDDRLVLLGCAIGAGHLWMELRPRTRRRSMAARWAVFALVMIGISLKIALTPRATAVDRWMILVPLWVGGVWLAADRFILRDHALDLLRRPAPQRWAIALLAWAPIAAAAALLLWP